MLLARVLGACDLAETECRILAEEDSWQPTAGPGGESYSPCERVAGVADLGARSGKEERREDGSAGSRGVGEGCQGVEIESEGGETRLGRDDILKGVVQIEREGVPGFGERVESFGERDQLRRRRGEIRWERVRKTVDRVQKR